MVLNRKQQRKQRSNRRGTKQFAAGCSTRKSKRTGMLQYGGVSPACVFDGASGADVLYRNSGVNIHNTNPQASLDLDNKFMSYGGAVPLGNNILQGGAAKCGDEGIGGAGNGKNETFKQYLEGLENQYMIGGDNGGNGNNSGNGDNGIPIKNPNPPPPPFNNKKNEGIGGIEKTLPINPKLPINPIINKYPKIYPNRLRNLKNEAIDISNKSQNGGGFSTDPSEYIAGLPVYKAYDDCCPPAIVNNQLVMGAPDQSVCGLGAIKGGARRRRRSSSRRSSRRSSKNNKTARRISKHKNVNRRTRRQRGGAVGDFVYSATKSTPAPMSNAFNGPEGVFRYPDDMMSRTFNEVQPNYSVNAI